MVSEMTRHKMTQAHLATINTVRSVYGMVARETSDRAEHSAAMHICARLAEVAAMIEAKLEDKL